MKEASRIFVIDDPIGKTASIFSLKKLKCTILRYIITFFLLRRYPFLKRCPICIKLSNISINFLSLKLSNVSFTYKSYDIAIQKIKIRINYGEFLKNTHPHNLFNIEITEINLTEDVPTSPEYPLNRKKQSHNANPYERIQKIWGFLLNTHLNISIDQIRAGTKFLSVHIINFVAKEKLINFELIKLNGLIDFKSIKISCHIKTASKEITLDAICFLENGGTSNLIFESLRFITRQVVSNCLLQLNFEFAIGGLKINNNHISDMAFIIKNIDAELVLHVEKNKIFLSEDSGGSINKILSFAISCFYDFNDKEYLHLNLAVETDVKALILEFGPLFTSKLINVIDLNGTLILQFRLMFNLHNPLEHFLETRILENKITIKDTNLLYLDALHETNITSHFKKKDKSYTYITLDKLSNQILTVLIHTEDPNFFKHSGVDPSFFGNALMLNITNKKMVKGASTITMQLVKNMYLNNSKILIRKFEEIIIALLIENYFMLPKNRILEAYINVIELAPNTFGIEQGCLLYFGKSYANLSLIEAISISYILPRPLHFYEALLSQTDQLRNNLSKHCIKVARALLLSKKITIDEFSRIEKTIKFKHPFNEFEIITA